jgi:hypothetical protein
MHGRLLFTIRDITSSNNNVVSDIVAKLKERSIVTILPEYVTPKALTVVSIVSIDYIEEDIKIKPEIAAQLIKQTIVDEFSNQEFNKSFSFSQVSNTVQQFSGYSLNSITNLSLKFTVIPSTVVSTINFKNAIRKTTSSTESGFGVISTEFTSAYYESGTVQIRDLPIIFSSTSINPPSIGKLLLFAKSPEGVFNVNLNSQVGEVDYKTGVVKIYPSLSTASFDLLVSPANTNQITAKDEVYLILDLTVPTPTQI